MPSLESFYKEYSCSHNAPLSCDRPLETAQQIKGAKFCIECGFPATLPIEVEIKGNQGSYQVTKFLGIRGLGRLYSGVDLRNQEPVIIKEYLLPVRCFNKDEALKRKETFEQVGGISLADGRQQNFRLIQTWEAIADEKGERCYLITKDTKISQTLGEYLIAYGAMTAPQVRDFLNQALQTLIFLHTQKLRFPSGQVQNGIEHGNISLDSILIKSESKQSSFLIYFCDLAKWENLFIPAVYPQPLAKTYKEDLESLGLLAFHLWLGRTTNYNTGSKIDPKEHELLPNTDNDLKQFIYRLLGFDAPLEDAETARQALLQLSQESQVNYIQRSTSELQYQKRFSMYRVLLGVLVLLLLSGGIWYYFWWRSKSVDEQYVAWNGLLGNFSEVPNISTGNFDYTSEKDSTWSYILNQAPVDEINLNVLLTKPKPNVEATFNYQENDGKNNSNIIKEVRDGRKNFAITSLEDIISEDMYKTEIAYDGLLVFVSSSKNKINLPKELDGKISIEQLRRIYTGEIKNWQQISPNISIPIELYIPKDAEAVEQFKRLVLKNNEKDIALFNEVAKSKIETTKTTLNKMQQSQGSGSHTGIISFGILGRIWRQCGGYPLTIVDKDNNSIPPIFSEDKQSKIDPSSDNPLCGKSNYFDVETFHSGENPHYPLSYPLYIVYPKNNSREPVGLFFADILKTRQGQCLLSKVGLVPLQPIPKKYIENNNACKSMP